jgi:chromosomal replication initiator protein
MSVNQQLTTQQVSLSLKQEAAQNNFPGFGLRRVGSAAKTQELRARHECTVNKSPIFTEMTGKPDVEKIWTDALKNLRSILNPDIFNLWFSSIRGREITDGAITLEVPNDFCELWLKDNYLGLIKDTIGAAAGQRLEIRFHASNTSAPEAFAPQRETKPAIGNGHVEEVDRPTGKELAFNPRNTFETFVVGSNNSFAHAAAMAVAKEPGKSYNPLFLYGGVGLGKTHLLHAIGQHVTGHKKGAKVSYVSSEKFTNEFVDAIQNNSLAKFRKKYRSCDVLLIDDVQFLSGKERIQEEFFHTFNALHEQHRQLVMTCDRPAGEIAGLEQRLVSRFEWGLVTDMQPPDIETRVAILRKKERAMGVTLQDDVVNFIAARIRANIRRLEGALIRVASFTSLTGKPVGLEQAEEMLRDVLSEEGKYSITIEMIQKKVAEHFDIRVADMTSKRRPENIAFPRQVAMYLSRTLTDASLSAIGEAFGGRDHGTVLHACKLVKDRMSVDSHVREAVKHIERKLQR